MAETQTTDWPAAVEAAVTFNQDGAAPSARVLHDAERRAFADFACLRNDQDPDKCRYAERLAPLYVTWGRFNGEYFDGRLVEPHITIARTAPRSLGHCEKTTGYGGKVEFTLNERLTFGTGRPRLVNPWPPAEGTRLFIE